MRKTLVIALLVAMVGVLALPAQAAPWTQSWLPDADLYCQQNGVLVAAGEWVGNPSAGTLWIADGEFAGHYATVTTEHYFVPGVDREMIGPYDVSGMEPFETRSFGEKAGLRDRVHCQVVSRFEGDGYAFTIVAPLELAKLR
jgi:hypothetical protein